MKGYLLDTHIFIWAISRPDKLGKKVSRIIDNIDTAKFISPATLLEIAQLHETKPRELNIKVQLATYISQGLSTFNVQVLALTPEHAQRYYEIQLVKDHRDQYDRTIIAQAASTGLTVLSEDRKFPFYPISVISD